MMTKKKKKKEQKFFIQGLESNTLNSLKFAY